MKDKNWNGYTLDEIRFQRVLAMTRLDIEKAKLLNSFNGLSKRPGQASASLLGRLAGALNWLDYAMLASTIAIRLVKFFRRHR